MLRSECKHFLSTSEVHMIIKKNSISEEITAYLTLQIESGAWKIGQLIPSEAKLCETLSVSRSSLRSALSKFAALGILHTEQGIGSVLQSNDVSNRFSKIDSLQYSDYVDIAKVLRFRLLIEPYAAECCAMLENGQLSLLVEELAHLYLKMQQSINDRQTFVDADLLFHSRIASSCGNELLAFSFDEVISVSKRTNEQMNVAFGYDTGIYHHGRILEALRNADPQNAKRYMQEHLSSALESIDLA